LGIGGVGQFGSPKATEFDRSSELVRRSLHVLHSIGEICPRQVETAFEIDAQHHPRESAPLPLQVVGRGLVLKQGTHLHSSIINQKYFCALRGEKQCNFSIHR